jgi:KDO2-lipid IV(A) lauroyltransferase
MARRPGFRTCAEYALVRLVLATPRLAPAYLKLLDTLVPRLRCVARRNLQLAMPELTRAGQERVIDGMFRSLARVIRVFSAFPAIDKSNVGNWIRYDGYEHFEAAMARGKGVLFATAHLGNWELSAFAHALMSAPMNVVVRPLDNPLLDAFVERRRSLSGNRIISKREYARAILAALRRNEAVGILVDQNSLPEHAAFVDFFGTPACTSLSFARLAHRSGAGVIPGYAIWPDEGGKFVLKFDPEILMTGDAVADTAAIQKHFEEVIRRHPDQWLWIHRRWKTRPAGAGAIY